MRTAILFSGGKDSCLALHYALKSTEVKCLITLVSENPASYMFHTPNIILAEKQAEAIGLPIIIEKTKGEKEIELKDLEKAIKKAKEKYEIKGIFTGAIASVYQSSRVQRICDELNLECINPLWKRDPEQHWQELLKERFEIIITSVSTHGLDRKWLGKMIDKESFNELKTLSKKFQFNLGFEGGEAETFVTNAPFFRKRIEIIKAKKEWKGDCGEYIIEKIKLS
jgi:ABC transporter with metal-binding/Fe-S-binding domain ATP-binding protein